MEVRQGLNRLLLHAELLLRSLLAEHPDCTPARLAVADYMFERGDLHGALQWLFLADGTADIDVGYSISADQVQPHK